jgi:type IV pilus secretin PilQ/predicted competence protein
MKMKFFVLGSVFATFLFTVSPSGSTLETAQRLSLQLESVPITMVLQMIAEQNNLNLVVSGEVEGDVTLRLENVDVATALEAILSPHGYNYYLKDDVIVVKPTSIDVPEELESKTITLQYIDPITAKKALESRRSPKGQIVILDKTAEDGRTSEKFQPNRVLVTDLRPVVAELTALIDEIDQPERLISIEVKIIETKVDSKTKLGFLWPSTIETRLGGGADSASASSSSSSSGSVAGQYDPNKGNWTWGTLSVAQLKTVLDLLNQSGNSKLISDPHITTLENHEAEIKVETIIPIPTVNRFTEGAAVEDILTFQDEEVGISLKVTPRVVGDGRITLDVLPVVEDIVGMAGPLDNQKPITSHRSIQTTITVTDGETAALGGLLKEDVIKQQQKVPLLGSIPLLGRLLFTNSSDEKTTTDLIILITPHIM